MSRGQRLFKEDMMNSDTCQMQVENACINLIKDHEEVLFVSVNTETKTSKCIGSQLGMDFLNRDIALVDKNSNFLELFQQFVKDQYNVTEVSIATEQKTIFRNDESSIPSSISMDLIGSNQLDFSQSMMENSVQDNILDSIITNENDFLTPFSQSEDGTLYQEKPLDNASTNENEKQKECIQTLSENSAQIQLFDNGAKNEIPIEKNVPDIAEKKEGKHEETVTIKQAEVNIQEEETSSHQTVTRLNISNIEEQEKETRCIQTGTISEINITNKELQEKETSNNLTGTTCSSKQKKEISNNKHENSSDITDSIINTSKETSSSQKDSGSDAKISKMVTRKKAGRPKKDSSEDKTGDREFDKSNESIKSKAAKTRKEIITDEKDTSSKHKTPNHGKVPAAKVSRSGRKVVMPKWRLEDQWEVKDIKTEPEDDSYDSSAKKPTVRDKLFSNTQYSPRVIKKENAEPGECPLKNAEEPISPPVRLSDKTRKKITGSGTLMDADKTKERNNCRTENENEERKQGKRKRESSPQNDRKEKVLKTTEDNDDKSHDVELTDKESDDIENCKTMEENNDNVDEIDEDFEDDDVLDPLFKEDSENSENEEYFADESDEKSPKKEKQSTGMWECGVCNSKAKKCWLVRRHMKRMHDLINKDLKPCRVCKKVFVYEDCPHELEESSKNYICDTCQKVFTTKSQYQIHIETHITEKEFPCNLCPKKFKSERYVKMHVYNTHKKRNGKALTGTAEPGICDICGKWFRFKCNAVRHREIHFEEKRFDCSICNMKFRHSSSLKRHMISHQGKAEFVCEQCGRSFKMKQTLIQHHRTHVKQPFLKCEYCPREFRTYKGKKYHILKDHGEKAVDFNFKSFVCETCGKQSASQLEYNEHKKNHDENRSHVCSICGCRWVTAAQLKAHRKSHNIAPYRYRCKVCNIPFKEASKIRLHMTKESHVRTCISMGLEPLKEKISDVTNTDIVEIMEQDFNFPLQSEEELQQELQSSSNVIEEVQEEIKVIHINPIEYDGSEAAHLKILNEEGVEIMYDEISLPQEEITVDGEQVIYQVEIDGQNAIICDNLTSQAVESILRLHSQT